MIWLGRLFRRLSLSAKLISSYLVVLGVGGLAITVVGSYIVSSTIMAEAERTVKHDLAIARALYEQELRVLRRTVEVAAAGITIPRLLEAGDRAALLDYLREVGTHQRLDFLTLVDADGRVLLRSTDSGLVGDDVTHLPAVATALRERHAVAGTHVFSARELERESPTLRGRARLPLQPTPRAAPPSRPVLTEGLVLTGAAPVRDGTGRTVGVLYAGHMINRNFTLVDQVWSELYSEEARRNGGTGTVTIFLGDTRVSTNVRTGEGRRALGTRVSEEVRAAVLEGGQTWNSRAFVVEDWFITAYEPIRDLGGRIVGMLYVGVPEASYAATRNGVIYSFLFIASVGFLVVLGATYLGIQRLTRPLGQMVEATRSIASGDFDHEVRVDPDSEGEIARLAGSFNLMLHSLR
ncbi:MAG: cache domain-containing protein, partial [Gemmatimonadota bacterium]